MKKNSGSALSQYAIFLGITVVILVPILLIFGKTIYANFEHFYNALINEEDQSTVSVNSNTPVNNNTLPLNLPVVNNNNQVSVNTDPALPVTTESQNKYENLSGLPKKPQMVCSGNTCTLDYGDFTLTGIPNDFSDYLQSSGTSGATDKIASIITEIYDQLDDESEQPIRTFLQSVISMIGTDNTDGRQADAKEIQYAYHMKIYECMAGGSCDGIVESTTQPGRFYHERNSGYTFGLPPENYEISLLQAQLGQIIGGSNDQLINSEFENVKQVCSNVSGNNGKDYTNQLVVIEALKNYALDVRETMYNEIRDTSVEAKILKDPTKVDIETVKKNVASKTEDDTAELMCAISGNGC